MNAPEQLEAPVAIIGGSGFCPPPAARIHARRDVQTPWGECSAAIAVGQCGETPILFLPRHGEAAAIAPHEVNYRANLHALRQLGAERIIAVNVVGGISDSMRTGRIVIPDQLIDYTWGRPDSFRQAGQDDVRYTDFETPYCESLRGALLRAGERAGLAIIAGGVYGVTQGPRLETAAEIRRMERDGCDIVGMTGMPEAALARELGCRYACCAMIVNPASGKSAEPLNLERVYQNIALGAAQIHRMLEQFLKHDRRCGTTT